MSATLPLEADEPPLPAADDARHDARLAGGETPRVEVQVAVRPAPDPSAVVEWATAALEGDAQHLCVRFVDRSEGAGLNRRFRGRGDATNVLSFPADEAGLLGDIAICLPVVAEEAREQGKSLDAHCAHMVVHGVLHLRGMDHDDDARAARMEAREAALLGTLGFSDPYAQA